MGDRSEGPLASFLFLRHGQTLWNEAGLTMGQTDIALSSIGRQEAEQAVDVLQNYAIDTIVCSPLKRCLATVSPFLGTGIFEFSVNLDWAERSWGVYEGLPKWQRTEDINPPGGESEGDFSIRISRALNALPKGRNVLLVSHSGVFREISRCGYMSSFVGPTPPHATPIVLWKAGQHLESKAENWPKP